MSEHIGEATARDRRTFMDEKTRALRTLQDVLNLELGQDVKILLDKIDGMLARKEKRETIVEMMVAEINEYMRKRMQETRFIPT
jgi:hypothetical protein